MRKLLLTLAFTTLAGAATAQAQDLTANVDVSKGGALKEGASILIPNVLLNIPADGSLFVANQRGGASAQAKVKYGTQGFTKEMLQDLATKAQADLADRFRKAGFTVKTWDDIKDNAEVAKWELMKADKDYGMPMDDVPGTNFYLVTPSDAQALKSGVTGPVWKFRNIAKDQNVLVIVPQYWFSAPQVWSDEGRGYKSVSAKVNIAPGMNMHGAFAWILNPKGGGTAIKLKDNMVNLTENAGALEEIDSKNMKAGGSIVSGVMGTGLGAGKIEKKTGTYILTVDQAAYTTGAMRGIGAFNQSIVDATVKERGK